MSLKPKAYRNEWKEARADEMKKYPSPPEARLWAVLEMATEILANQYGIGYGLFGFEFERQAIVAGFIPDFYFPEAKLAVEVDGKYHFSQRGSDGIRDKILFDSYGILVLRYPASSVMCNFDDDTWTDFEPFLPTCPAGILYDISSHLYSAYWWMKGNRVADWRTKMQGFDPSDDFPCPIKETD